MNLMIFAIKLVQIEQKFHLLTIILKINCSNYYNFSKIGSIDTTQNEIIINKFVSKYINKCNIKYKKCTMKSKR